MGRIRVDKGALWAAAWDVGELLQIVEDGRHAIDAGTHLLTAVEALERLRQQHPTAVACSRQHHTAHPPGKDDTAWGGRGAPCCGSTHVRKAAGVSSAALAERMDALLRQGALQ